jgi:hypothetical protein
VTTPDAQAVIVPPDPGAMTPVIVVGPAVIPVWE